LTALAGVGPRQRLDVEKQSAEFDGYLGLRGPFSGTKTPF
jgi:hypothetical protein